MKSFIPVLLLFSLLSCTPENQTQPNIILIMTDDQGYGDYSCHGNPYINTPNLDKFSAESVNFSNFHVATTCSPTRAGLLTGMHCNRTGTWHTVNGRSLLSTRFPTIANMLSQSGYHTSIFGKWHLGDNYPYRPQDRGFQEVLVHGGGGVGQGPDMWGNDYFDDTYLHNGVEKQYEGYCADIWFGEAIKYMKEQSAKSKPFFCYISSNTAHGPHYAPQKYIDPFLNNDEIVNAGFMGQLANIDDNVGRLMTALKDMELEENTIVLFTNDNGTAGGANFDKSGKLTTGFNAGMRGKKGSAYEGGHRVALFARFPTEMDIPISTYDQLTNYTDIVPTLLDLTTSNTLQESTFDGESIAPLLKEGTQESLDDRIVIVDTQRSEWPVKWKNSSVMKNEWRLINQKELYNLKFDPGQQDNIIEHHPDLVADLKQAYELWWTDQLDDHAIDNRIVIGSTHENPSLLMSHDWHAEHTPPWHQSHVRSAKVSNGHWSLQVAESGRYAIRLYRWHPQLAKNATESLAAYDDWKEGIALDLVEGRIRLGENEQFKAESLEEGTHYLFETDLEKGDLDFQSWIIDRDGIERGAYYVEIEKV